MHLAGQLLKAEILTPPDPPLPQQTEMRAPIKVCFLFSLNCKAKHSDETQNNPFSKLASVQMVIVSVLAVKLWKQVFFPVDLASKASQAFPSLTF